MTIGQDEKGRGEGSDRATHPRCMGLSTIFKNELLEGSAVTPEKEGLLGKNLREQLYAEPPAVKFK